MDLTFKKLTTPNLEIAATFERWENDPLLIPLTRPNQDKEALERRTAVTVDSLTKRLEQGSIFLIYAGGQLVGEMNYQIDPPHLYQKVAGTAWIGIGIGEATVRGKGVGTRAMHYLEEEIQAQGLVRIELGVFEFNARAIKLYTKMGYQEIARIDNFTYWQGRMWQDIRMEKYLASPTLLAGHS